MFWFYCELLGWKNFTNLPFPNRGKSFINFSTKKGALTPGFSDFLTYKLLLQAEASGRLRNSGAAWLIAVSRLQDVLSWISLIRHAYSFAGYVFYSPVTGVTWWHLSSDRVRSFSETVDLGRVLQVCREPRLRALAKLLPLLFWARQRLVISLLSRRI